MKGDQIIVAQNNNENRIEVLTSTKNPNENFYIENIISYKINDNFVAN